MPFDSPQFPTPPDPIATANAQGQVNADTARLQQSMNLVDQVTPDGTVRYTRLGPSGQGTGVTVGNTGTGTTGTPSTPYYGSLANGTPVTQQNFNSQAYLAANPDVAAAISAPNSWLTGPDAAWQHYTQYGASEGRTWDGGPAAPGSIATTAAPKLNLNINWASPLNNGMIDPYQGLSGGKDQYDALRRSATGYTGDFGGGKFETYEKGLDYSGQVKYINALEQAGADPDYIRGLIQQLPSAPGLTAPNATPYSTDNTDRWQQTTTLSPGQQSLYDQNQALNQTLLSLAQGQAGRVGTALATPLNTNGLPDLKGSIFGIGSIGGNDALSNGQIDPYGGLKDQATFDQARRDLGYSGDFGGGAFEQWYQAQPQQVKDQYIGSLRAAGADPDYLKQEGATADPFGDIGKLYGTVTDAQFQRLQPQIDRQRTQLQTQLQQQGVVPGSEAWKNAMDDLNRQQNDLYLGVNAQGTSSLASLFSMGLSDANLSNSARSQGLQERAYLTNTPINQINSLRAGTQVSQPSAYTPVPTQVQAPDYQGAVYNSAQMAQQQAQAQAQANSAMMGDIFGLGAGALTGWGTSGFKKFW